MELADHRLWVDCARLLPIVNRKEKNRAARQSNAVLVNHLEQFKLTGV
jgi:phage anti-repressor protein